MSSSIENLLSGMCAESGLKWEFLQSEIQHGRMRLAQGGKDEDLSELKISKWGRFGNSICQLKHVIQLAERLSIKKIRLPNHPILAHPFDSTLNGISFSSDNDANPSAGGYLKGIFYNVEGLFPDTGRSQRAEESVRIAQDYLMPLFLHSITEVGKCWGDDVLAVHLRAGDVFKKSQPHPIYVQPPLSYYIQALKMHQALHKLAKVILVFEDNGNPCVEALQRHLAAEGIPFQIQSGTLREDVACLPQARHMIASFGTFCFTIALLSAQLRSVYCFRQPSAYEFAGAKNITAKLCTTSPAYMQIGEWRNTPDQIESMLSFPEAELSFTSLDELQLE